MFAQIWQIFIGKHANKCRHPSRSCLTFYSGAGKPYTGRLRLRKAHRACLTGKRVLLTRLGFTSLAQGAPGLPDRQAGAFSASRFHLAGARRADFVRFAHCAGGRRAKPASWQALIPWRTERDSNPRYAINVYSLSRGAPSATRPPVHRFGEPSARRAKPASWQALLASATCPCCGLYLSCR